MYTIAPMRGRAVQCAPRPAGPTSRGVYEWLVAAIRRGRIRPGDPIREEALERQLRCSRTPVREALQRLRAEGYLARGRRRGLSVAEPTQEELLDLSVVRETLEGLAARLAARGITTSEVYFLEELYRDMERALERGELGELATLNAEFHAVVWRAACNRYLARELQKLAAHHPPARHHAELPGPYPGGAGRAPGPPGRHPAGARRPRGATGPAAHGVGADDPHAHRRFPHGLTPGRARARGRCAGVVAWVS